MRWSFTAGSYVRSSPAVSADGGTVFVGSEDHNLYAIRTTDGALQWKFATGDWVKSSPALSSDGRTVYVGS